MHTHVAMQALANIAVAAPVLKKLMEKYPDDFVYGAVSPDIIVGKKYAGIMHHCHNWDMGWLILSESKSDAQKASAYGYLVHLAADIVAHNYYIPFKIVRSYKARVLSHTYWEMRFDLGLPEQVWKHLDKISELDCTEFDQVLNLVLKKTIFSFKTNKRIFSSILALQKMRGLRESLKLYEKQSRYEIELENRQHYLDLVMESVLAFIADPDHAWCLEIDPTGLSRLTYADNLRRRMKALLSKQILSQAAADRLVELVRERLVVGLYRPNLVLPDITDVLFGV
ncbi:MAG: zinc dependent phospholipase C family protein [Pseudomonadota bacterium]